MSRKQCEADSTCPFPPTGYTAEHPVSGRLFVCNAHPKYPIAYPNHRLPDVYLPDHVSEDHDHDINSDDYTTVDPDFIHDMMTDEMDDYNG